MLVINGVSSAREVGEFNMIILKLKRKYLYMVILKVLVKLIIRSLKISLRKTMMDIPLSGLMKDIEFIAC